MKFIISLLVAFKASAAPINIYYEKEEVVAQKILKILNENYLVPLNLISKQRINRCKDLAGKSKLDLCINVDDELYILNADKEFINKSLKIFLN